MPNLSELYLPKALLLKSWVEKSIGECTNIEVLSVCINEAKAQDIGGITLITIFQIYQNYVK